MPLICTALTGSSNNSRILPNFQRTVHLEPRLDDLRHASTNRIDLTPETDVDAILQKVKEMYKDEQVNDIDGVKIDFADGWVHLRKSNTEPIIRVYSEAQTMAQADELGKKLMQVVYDMQ